MYNVHLLYYLVTPTFFSIYNSCLESSNYYYLNFIIKSFFTEVSEKLDKLTVQEDESTLETAALLVEAAVVDPFAEESEDESKPKKNKGAKKPQPANEGM